MNKSHLGTADNPQEGVVTAHDIGRLVDVVNVGKGFLRYVGPIHGKEGLFCGIELLEANGKHDGSFQGVSYFIATPLHGIFAPIFRVTLDVDERPKPPPIPPSNRLSRSALPALQLRNPLTQEYKPEDDVMSTSVYVSSTKPIQIKNCRPPETDPMQMSIFSDMMDGSMVGHDTT
uniref:CAP-Gly domain-containing protein n=1 Tax=Caenorhabditis tropicalis TaxID=1561998 RepID=A0A1I7TEI8_9PELO